MTLTTNDRDKLDGMCPAAKVTTVGTELYAIQTAVTALQAVAGGSGEYTVLEADDTAGTVDINTGVTITGWIVQIYRAGVMVMEDAVVTAATTVLTVADGAVTYALTAGDIVHYMVW